MKKLIISLVVVIFSTIIIAPKIISTNIDAKISEIVSGINNIPHYTAELISKEHSWFSNKGSVKLTLGFPPMDSTNEKGIEFLINFHTHNGLINSSGLGLSKFYIDIPAPKLREHLTWDEDTSFYRVEGKLHLNSDISYQDYFPKFTFSSDDGDTLAVEQYQGAATTVKNNLVYKGMLPKVNFVSEDAQRKIFMTKLHINSTLPTNILSLLQESIFYNSSTDIGLEAFTFSIENNFKKGKLKNLLLLSNTYIDKDDKNLGHFDLTYKVKEITLPDAKGKDLEMGVKVANINVPVFEKINKYFQEMNINEEVQNNSEALKSSFMQIYEKQLLDLLTSKPEFNVTFKGEIIEGLAEGVFDLNLDTKLLDIVSLPQAPNDPAFWLSHINSQANIKTDKKFITSILHSQTEARLKNHPNAANMSEQEKSQAITAQTEKMLSMLLAQGFIVEKDGAFESHLELKDKKATVNGNQIPLPFLPQ